MNLKTGILAAVAALTLAAPAAALAQPYYGYGYAPRYADRDWRRDDWRRDEWRRDHWRHEERERDFRRDEGRRAYGDYGARYGYGGGYGSYGGGYGYGYSRR